MEHWTDELLDLMLEKMMARKIREAQRRSSPGASQGGQAVSDGTLFKMMGVNVRRETDVN